MNYFNYAKLFFDSNIRVEYIAFPVRQNEIRYNEQNIDLQSLIDSTSISGLNNVHK